MPLDWLNAIAQLLGPIAWPATVVVLALLYRHQLRGLLGRVEKVEYPGGSITMQDVSRLEKAAAEARELPSAPPDDIHALLAQLLTEIERELFRIAQLKLTSRYRFVSLAHTLRELRNADAIPMRLAAAIEEFAGIYDRSASVAKNPDEINRRIAITANRLLTQLHRQRLIVEMEDDFAGHGLWHMHLDVEGPAKRYYWWSPVAASCPKFEYDYDIYRIAAEQHNNRLREKMGYEAAKRGMVEIIRLADYVEVLRFRESELRRVLDAYEVSHEAGEKANQWQWPQTWGHISWSGPVVSKWGWEAARELMDTQLAISRYQRG